MFCAMGTKGSINLSIDITAEDSGKSDYITETCTHKVSTCVVVVQHEMCDTGNLTRTQLCFFSVTDVAPLNGFSSILCPLPL